MFADVHNASGDFSLVKGKMLSVPGICKVVFLAATGQTRFIFWALINRWRRVIVQPHHRSVCHQVLIWVVAIALGLRSQ